MVKKNISSHHLTEKIFHLLHEKIESQLSSLPPYQRRGHLYSAAHCLDHRHTAQPRNSLPSVALTTTSCDLGLRRQAVSPNWNPLATVNGATDLSLPDLEISLISLYRRFRRRIPATVRLPPPSSARSTPID
ncbi:hypothetical protein Dimus_011473 [Dionaea muscipula]